VATDRGDAIFLIRLRHQDGSKPPVWRGSVYEVATGIRLYVSNLRDAADFIDARLADFNAESAGTKRNEEM
jgi:hypothetical protein